MSTHTLAWIILVAQIVTLLVVLVPLAHHRAP